MRNKSAAGGKSKAGNAVWPWRNTSLPATPTGVPQLLSGMAVVPDKSIAVAAGGMFGSSQHDLLWLENHLPDSATAFAATDDENQQRRQQQFSSDVTELQHQVELLETSLAAERQSNQAVLDDISQARICHDNAVAMISLVRQETESVLHRHNVLLESDEVMEAAAAAAPDDEDDDAEDGNNGQEEDDAEEEGDEEEGGEADTEIIVSQELDEANDGDDEVSGPEDDWNKTNTNKRSNEEGGPDGSRIKRRKV
jgi:hypothetical protein